MNPTAEISELQPSGPEYAPKNVKPAIPLFNAAAAASTGTGRAYTPDLCPLVDSYIAATVPPTRAAK